MKKPKASDELRQWSDANCGGYIDGELRDELCAIADRIDNEMVELPVSADGEILTGGEMCFWTSAEQEDRHSFGCVVLRCGEWYVEDTSGIHTYRAESVWCHRPDSFERIAKELEGLSVDSGDNHYVSTHCSDLAERIRRLAKEGER